MIEMRPRSFSLDRVGIETVYGGVTFRSRLEARWAAMFDRMKWPWAYEPIDLAGYIPDFVLPLPRAPLLVEVKPAVAVPELREAERKIRMGGWRGDYLIVGGSLLGEDDGQVGLSFGILSYWQDDLPNDWGPTDVAQAHRCVRCRKISAHHASGRWRCLLCGAYDGNGYIDALGRGELRVLWAAAGNTVQWRPDGA